MLKVIKIFIFYFYLCAYSVESCGTSAVARQSGDIMIGGIFSIHKGILNVTNRAYSSDFNCTMLQLNVLNEALSMIYTTEQINNSTLLPGIKLGYEIYDSCSSALKAIQNTLQLFPEIIAKNNSDSCNKQDKIPVIKVVVGEKYSEFSVSMSRILSSYFIPQISPASSASILSDKLRFPSFLRTVPSDEHQTRAIVKLIKEFGWNWAGIITNDDDYGSSALKSLNTLLVQEGICIAFSKTLPSYVEDANLHKELDDAIDKIKNNLTVVIVFVKGPIVRELFIKAISMNISRTWIASDSWSYSNEVYGTKNIDKVGTIIGINFKAGSVPGFTDYVRNLQLPSQGYNSLIKQYKEMRFGCTDEYREYLNCNKSSSESCNGGDFIQYKSPLACKIEDIYAANDNYLAESIEKNKIYSTSLAITAIAQAIRNIVCQNGTCMDSLNFSPHQLLIELKKGDYFYNKESFRFDASGDGGTGYDFINWKTNPNIVFENIGQYDLPYGVLKINKSRILWNTNNNQVPFLNCSKKCDSGYYKQHSYISCCYQCLPCAEQYYAPDSDMSQCLKCPNNQWSKSGSPQCENKTIEYFQWSNPLAIVLLIFVAFIFLLVIITGIVFIKYSNTPTVKAAGGNYNYVLILSLVISMINIVFFIGKPSDTFCQIRQPLYGISFTISVSCILIKSLRILLAFESAKKFRPVLRFTYQPAVIICGLTLGQLCLCILWHTLKRPFVDEISNTDNIVVQCNEGSYVAFGVMLGYIGFLSFICFVLAYKGRKLPKRYNEARFITFSMLIYMFVWIIFIPIYIKSDDMYLSAVQSLAMLASVYGLVFCHLLPALYILVFKKKINTKERYLQSISVFHNTAKRVLSLYTNNWDSKSTQRRSSKNADSKTCTDAAQIHSDNTHIMRKRRNSC